MKYGDFSKDGREYIIKKPDTPKPWFNYLFNDEYHALVSQTGGGYSYYKDPKSNRILRYDHIQTDRPGRYIFMMDKDTGDKWSSNWQPLRKKLDSWKCIHGLGYTKIQSKEKNISTEITYAVPLEDSLELWVVKVKNEGKKKRHLKVFPFVEFVSGDIELEACYRNIIMLYNQADFDEKDKAIIAFKHPFRAEHKRGYSFFSTNLPIKRYDTRKEHFLGEYNDIESPESIMKHGKCSNSFTRGEDMVGVFECDLSLKPKEEKEFVIVLGFNEDRQKISFYLRKYRNMTNVKRELRNINKHWKDLTEKIMVKTPDPEFDLMVNMWGKYQLSAITHWRGTSHYHGVEGGLGYRDTAQDSEGLLSLDMRTAMKKLESILKYQYKSGHAVSGFSQTEGSWDELYQSGVIGKADVAVWLPYTVVSYVKETGDVDFLKKEYRFCDGDKASVYEHILRAVRYLYSKRGQHKLPYILKADWNDAYDHVGLKGKGESVWLAMALARACMQVGELAGFIGDENIKEEMDEKYRELKEIINDEGWDGNWYIAAYNDEGMKIGSDRNKEGKVPLNSQTWAILSDIVPESRMKKILEKIDKYLDTPYGPALFLPSYTAFNPGIGRVTAFAAGTKENAAVFSHACAFKIVSDCTINRGNEAYETYKKLLPMNTVKEDHTMYKVEPYVWAEYIIGPGSKYRFGEGAFTWNTGTAPWMFIAATEWMLGARREFEGLLIDPCLPSKWKQCWIRRPFRGAVYEITVKNPKGVQSGVKKIIVDGKEHKSNIIKPHKDGRVHKVEVLMGAKSQTKASSDRGKKRKKVKV